MSKFKVGDRVVDTDDPDWGVGYVMELTPHLTIRFPHNRWDTAYFCDDEISALVPESVHNSKLFKALK